MAIKAEEISALLRSQLKIMSQKCPLQMLVQYSNW